jgi:hypothetical protein
MQFYVYLNGEKRGPLSSNRVQLLLEEGILHSSDLASNQPDGEWKPLGVLAASAASPRPFLRRTGRRSRRFRYPRATTGARSAASAAATLGARSPTDKPRSTGAILALHARA